ncbi:hypothetical protein Anapl_11552 [Anas platyrhynchos]|uniref:Uncharacterized protein n=1 Tax=Anas platyrhynchos TaxID=8839 RepID=R0JWR9_ANAPL|nr:hypothetical protein Anapl_11552 [Anas platyrhynchos]
MPYSRLPLPLKLQHPNDAACLCHSQQPRQSSGGSAFAELLPAQGHGTTMKAGEKLRDHHLVLPKALAAACAVSPVLAEDGGKCRVRPLDEKDVLPNRRLLFASYLSHLSPQSLGAAQRCWHLGASPANPGQPSPNTTAGGREAIVGRAWSQRAWARSQLLLLNRPGSDSSENPATPALHPPKYAA